MSTFGSLIEQDTRRQWARLAAPLWGADPASVEHITDAGNFVYALTVNGERHVLRLTSPSHRTRAWNLAEINYLQHAARCGVPVSSTIGSEVDRHLEEVTHQGQTLYASIFTWAEGVVVEPGDPLWDEAFLTKWGETLARIHVASQSFETVLHRRWHWTREPLLTRAPALIPADNTEAHRELAAVTGYLRGLEELDFGMIHADFAPQNFHYSPEAGITAFDFGNCCYHHFAADVAISLSVLYRHDNRAELRRWLLAGYERVRATPNPEHLDWLIRLRVLYVYLSRLAYFGPRPTPDQARRIEELGARVGTWARDW